MIGPLSGRFATFLWHCEQTYVVSSNQWARQGTQARQTQSKQQSTPATLGGTVSVTVTGGIITANQHSHLHRSPLLVEPRQSPSLAKWTVYPLGPVAQSIQGRYPCHRVLCSHGQLLPWRFEVRSQVPRGSSRLVGCGVDIFRPLCWWFRRVGRWRRLNVIGRRYDVRS